MTPEQLQQEILDGCHRALTGFAARFLQKEDVRLILTEQAFWTDATPDELSRLLAYYNQQAGGR